MAKKKQGKTQYHKAHIGKFVGALCEQYKLESAEVVAFLKHNFPELTDKTKCANCGASMAIYEHRIDTLDALLVFGMGKIVGARVKDGMNFTQANKVHLQTMLNKYYSVPSRSTQCAKLGLIAKVMVKNKSGKRVHDRKAGWAITDRGFAFLAGKPVPAKVHTFRNQITERFEEMITIDQIKGDSAQSRELAQYKEYPFDKLENYSVAGFAQPQLI